MALNKSSYIDTIYFNHAVVAKNPLPPAFWGYNDKVKDYSYDPRELKNCWPKRGLPRGLAPNSGHYQFLGPITPMAKKWQK